MIARLQHLCVVVAAWLVAGTVPLLTSDSRLRGWSDLPRSAGSIEGVVVRADNDSAIADVEVWIQPTSRVTRTNERGVFVFDSVVPGHYTISLRRVGFAPLSRGVNVSGNRSDMIHVRLQPLTPTLAEVTVKATALPIAPRGFDERRAAGVGRFIGPEDLRTFGGRAVSSVVMHKVAGFHIVRISRGSMSAGSAIASRRFHVASARRPEEAVCFAQVFLNGHRVSKPGPGEPFDIDGLRLDDVLAMEFYRGAAETPTEFNGPMAACGTVAIWTK